MSNSAISLKGTVGQDALRNLINNAAFNEWNSVAMVYNGAQLHFWLNGNPEDHAANDSGNLVTVDNPLFIGQAGTGQGGEYFVGQVDEVSKAWVDLGHACNLGMLR